MLEQKLARLQVADERMQAATVEMHKALIEMSHARKMVLAASMDLQESLGTEKEKESNG